MTTPGSDQERRGDRADAVRVRELVRRKVRHRRKGQSEPLPEGADLLVCVLTHPHDPSGVGLLEALHIRGRHLADGACDLVEEDHSWPVTEVDARDGRRRRAGSKSFHAIRLSRLPEIERLLARPVDGMLWSSDGLAWTGRKG